MSEAAVANGVFTSLAALTRLQNAVVAQMSKPNQRSTGLLPGETTSRHRGAGKTFEEIRPYLPGDDIRFIDWRVTARSQETQLRVFAADREKPLHIITDQRRNMFFGSDGAFKSVTAAQCAAVAAWQYVSIGEPVGGHVVTNAQVRHQSARRSTAGALRYLRLLTDANQQCNAGDPDMSWPDTLTRAAPNVRLGAHLLIISDWQTFDQSCEATLRRLASRQPTTLVQIIEPLEHDLAVRGKLGISNGVDRYKVIASRAFRSHYQQAAEQRQQKLETAVTASRINHIKVRCDAPIDAVIRQMIGYE